MNKHIAGVDIGNATTETAIARVDSATGQVTFLSGGIVKTTGIKGTADNISGVFASLKMALEKAGLTFSDLSVVQLNEAAPVIGDVAMDTITETIITESTMIGHNPATPGGLGLGQGFTVLLQDVTKQSKDERLVVVIPKTVDFTAASTHINDAVAAGYTIAAAICQGDDGVLIANRLKTNIPIVDEVALIDRVPLNMPAAVEVAEAGGVVNTLSNPYGIATVFRLNPEETKLVVPIAKSLIGNRSAVVIKTPAGDVKERVIPAGKVHVAGERQSKAINVDEGAQAIMQAVTQCTPITDIAGEPGTNAGGMFERVRQVMSHLSGKHPKDIKIRDLLAVDTFAPQQVTGALAGEYAMENAVGIAAMVQADKLQMQVISDKLSETLGVPTEIGGVEADMAVLGALTTPGSSRPLAIIDMGAGSTDASFISKEGQITSTHLAGAGNMVTLLINTELGLNDIQLAEDIKRHPLAKVESIFHIRHEDGTVQFFNEPLEPRLFARVVILTEDGLVPVPGNHSLEKIRAVRRSAKEKVFVTNAVRALTQVCPTHNIRSIEYLVLVGGSSLDFEIPQMVTAALSHYGIVAGQANVRGTEGPRNAVATGLVLAHGQALTQRRDEYGGGR